MADNKNEARALRVLEIMNDFRTLQLHISSHVTRAAATPPDQASQNLPGYVLLRQCQAEAQVIVQTYYNQRDLGIVPGRVPATEVQKATLMRIILDASARRFRAHKIYLRAAAATRWIALRQQVLGSGRPIAQQQQQLSAVNQRLDQEISQITNTHIYNDLRAADQRKHYWITEDPSLERILAWISTQ